ncbi:MAG: hydrogenase nickel incorporation protein HypB [Proteobacteria bacterium]|nr:hydrogenase nickel incorporation protein HypB [Pseudomonadota bacterium]MBU1641188.1 hydrogenase nickel incorporation protein HypB [Pseudomonadota bacterium]
MCDSCGCHPEDSNEARQINLGQNILSLNNEIADHTRQHLQEDGIFCLNIISAPGSGKTSLLERLGRDYGHKLTMAVIVGDQQTDNDQKRLKEAGLNAVQINTGAACHLDARMVHKAMHDLDLSATKLLIIENIGNMVCPTAYDLGEDLRIAVVSTPEGEDKPAKYPDLILSSDVLLINKIDLLPYLTFNIDECCAQARKLKPGLKIFQVSASTGEGMAEFWQWLSERCQTKKG